MPLQRLSKSRYVKGLRCPKALWLELNARHLRTPEDASTLARFAVGHDVGDLAQGRFPGGVLIAEGPREITQAITSTKAAANGGAPAIFEASAEHGGGMSRIDILKREGDAWDMYEVKSATKAKPEFLRDLAFQRWVFEGAGYKIRKTFLAVLNKDYVRKGDIDVFRLLKDIDCTAETAEMMKEVPGKVDELRRTAGLQAAPPVDIGPRCCEPYRCEFREHCWKDVPSDSVLYLAGADEALLRRLREVGCLRTGDIPEGFPLSRDQELQAQAEKTGKCRANKKAIKKFIEGLCYPLYFLDFETFNPGIPVYEGTRPFQVIAFQASVHVQEKEGGALTHLEFLGDEKSDPRAALANFLVKSMGTEGSIIAYSKYERQRLNALAREVPDLAMALKAFVPRIADIFEIFQERQVVHPAFKGSASIKYVLPALVPAMSYKSLVIREGDAASRSYAILVAGTNPEDAAEIRRALLEYCGQDTLAMVELLKVLRKMVA